MRVALLVKGTAPDPEATGKGTTFPAGKTEEGEEGGTIGVIVASAGAAGTLPTYPEDAGKRACGLHHKLNQKVLWVQPV